MSNEDIINQLPNPENGYPGYTPQPLSQGYLDNVQNGSNFANRSLSDFTGDINKNLDQSNLMGSLSQDPESQALSARANQIYQSNVNTLSKQADPLAEDRQIRLQNQDINNRAARYQQSQTLQNISYSQQTYQRQYAILQEQTKRQLLESLFQGVGTLGTAFGLKGLMHAGKSNPSELPPGVPPELPPGVPPELPPGVPPGPGSDAFTYQPGSSVPDSFQSSVFGNIGGH